MDTVLALLLIVVGLPNFCQFVQWVMERRHIREQATLMYWERKLAMAKQTVADAEQQITRIRSKT